MELNLKGLFTCNGTFWGKGSKQGINFTNHSDWVHLKNNKNNQTFHNDSKNRALKHLMAKSRWSLHSGTFLLPLSPACPQPFLGRSCCPLGITPISTFLHAECCPRTGSSYVTGINGGGHPCMAPDTAGQGRREKKGWKQRPSLQASPTA